MFSVCLTFLCLRNNPTIATTTPTTNTPMTPPTIAAVGKGFDGPCGDCDAGFSNEVGDDSDAFIDVVLLRKGIDDNVAKDGVYVM
jgi:hypothetical protein